MAISVHHGFNILSHTSHLSIPATSFTLLFLKQKNWKEGILKPKPQTVLSKGVDVFRLQCEKTCPFLIRSSHHQKVASLWELWLLKLYSSMFPLETAYRESQSQIPFFLYFLTVQLFILVLKCLMDNKKSWKAMPFLKTREAQQGRKWPHALSI